MFAFVGYQAVSQARYSHRLYVVREHIGAAGEKCVSLRAAD
jgi:hypothetical protein